MLPPRLREATVGVLVRWNSEATKLRPEILCEWEASTHQHPLSHNKKAWPSHIGVLTGTIITENFDGNHIGGLGNTAKKAHGGA